jgi:hypothetical protein
MSLTRRAALQVLGAAALPTLARAAGAPGDWSARAHASAAAAPPALFRTDERALISAIADAVLPRTDTPGALDVNVAAFIEVLVADWMTDAERTGFRDGLAALDAHALATEGSAWPGLSPVAQSRELDWAEADTTEPVPAQRAFRRLKGFVLHGYFTSARVQREVFRTNITPGRYLGCAPIADAGDDDA